MAANKPHTLTKAQQKKISIYTKRFGKNEKISSFEKDGSYYFKTAYGNGYAVIQRNGKVEAGNIGI